MDDTCYNDIKQYDVGKFTEDDINHLDNVEKDVIENV